jgi:hypothetical protein
MEPETDICPDCLALWSECDCYEEDDPDEFDAFWGPGNSGMSCD